MSLHEDIKFGLRCEKKLYNLLKRYNKNLIWNSAIEPYATFDFSCGNRVFELKSRRYNKEHFDKDGHMCEPEKLKYLQQNPQLKGKIFFMFYNGLWVYDVSKDSKLKGVRQAIGGRTDRAGRNELKQQSYIHKDYLKLVSKNITCPKPLYLSKCVL